MPLSLLCDEHIPYQVIEGLRRRGIDAISVQQVGLRSATDEVILQTALQSNRSIYTSETDFLRLHSRGFSHPGIIYHRPVQYSIRQAIRIVALACEVLSAEDMANRVEFV